MRTHQECGPHLCGYQRVLKMWNSDKNSALGLVHDTHVAVSIEPFALPGRTELAFSAGTLNS